jgi:hypothetical protein
MFATADSVSPSRIIALTYGIPINYRVSVNLDKFHMYGANCCERRYYESMIIDVNCDRNFFVRIRIGINDGLILSLL